jgi:hypothetical protein
MRHFTLPERRHGISRLADAVTTAVYGPFAPHEYLRLRRVAAGYEPDRFARDYATIAAHGRPNPVPPLSVTESRIAFRRLRGELALLEQPGAIATSDATLRRIASLIPFDPAVYRQLASEPADRHPRICRSCGCSGHDACSHDDSVCTWVTAALCSHCVERSAAAASVAA